MCVESSEDSCGGFRPTGGVHLDLVISALPCWWSDLVSVLQFKVPTRACVRGGGACKSLGSSLDRS